MTRTLTVLLAVVAAVGHADSPPAPAPAAVLPAVLWWNNGETLSGEFSEASATSVTWKSTLFESPLELDRGVLLKADRRVATSAPSGTFQYQMRDGSQLFGEPISVTSETVGVQSARCGDVVLKRSEVLSMRRLHGERLLLAGPNGDVGWELNPPKPVSGDGAAKPPPPSPPPAIPPLLTGAGGALVMPYFNRTAYLDVKLPERLDVEFQVRASKRPDFKLTLATPRQTVSIETWDEDLVLRAGTEFKAIRKLVDTDRDVALRFCWDTNNRRCTVYSAGGELLVEWQTPAPPPPAEAKKPAESGPPGLTKVGAGTLVLSGPPVPVQLQNKGRDLSLHFIRLREWDGAPPPRVDLSRPRLELADGRIVEGGVSSGGADSLVLRALGEDEDRIVPLDQVDAVVFSVEPAKVWQPKAAVSCNDGTFLVGHVSDIKDGVASLKTSFCRGSLAARLDGLRLIRFRENEKERPAETPLAELDKIVVQQTTLHGKLAAATDNQPRWLAVGALRPAIPSKSVPSEITRTFPAKATFPSVPALFYTKSGDVLPGKLASIGPAGVEFASEVIEAQKLSTGNLNAIQFDPPVGASLEGFDGAGWRILKGNADTVKRAGKGVTMQPGSSFGHPFAMQGDEIQFSVKPEGWSTFRMRLFCNGTDGTKATTVMLVYTGYELYSGLEEAEGQLGNEVINHIGSGEFTVRLVIDDRAVELQAGGMPIQTFQIPASARRGAGFIIEPTSAWGNAVTAVHLDKFTAHLSPGRTWLPEIALDAKQQALTVPRFRHNNPPKQALIAANGDILRGEIEATTANAFGFRSGLEELRVNRDRVKAIVWLGKPVEGAAPAAAGAPMPPELDQTLDTYNRYSNADFKQLIEFLQSQAPALKFKLPETDAKRIPFRFGGQTIRQTLDALCSAFHLAWRVDGSGMIVISQPPPPGSELTQRIYWLNPSAVIKPDAAKSILSGKGITFGEGAWVGWNPDSRQLTMRNTAANHTKLTALIESDLGGSAGSPTHWLALTSGARLGLIVDKFDSEHVTGHHPIYGRCQIPFADVSSIRTTAPPTSATYKTLENWRLVYAPEPVLPEAGGGNGEKSPMLGKTPKPFKLALLGGGDFDLNQQKGKIVVLDFWATWCGPCVKSLPGLIESMAGFPKDQVVFAGLDQGEPPEQVKRFLEIRGWKLTVALDAQQDVARQFGVDGIPHTVVIGPDGKVAWTRSGYDPEDESGAAKIVKQLLSVPGPAAGQ